MNSVASFEKRLNQPRTDVSTCTRHAIRRRLLCISLQFHHLLSSLSCSSPNGKMCLQCKILILACNDKLQNYVFFCLSFFNTIVFVCFLWFGVKFLYSWQLGNYSTDNFLSFWHIIIFGKIGLLLNWLYLQNHSAFWYIQYSVEIGTM